MKDELIFRKMRLRFVALVMLLSMLVLGVIATASCVVMYNDSKSKISDMIDTIDFEVSMNETRPPNAIRERKECSYMTLDANYKPLRKMGAFDMYKESELNVLIDAFVTTSDSKVRVNGRYYYFRIKQNDSGYAIVAYDYTNERSMLITLFMTSVALTLGGTLLCGVIAYLLSNKVIAPARDALRRQKELVANASHELKTPITIINADLSLITADDSATVRDNETWLTGIAEQTGRMQTMISEMLELSRLDTGNIEITPTEVDLPDMLEVAVMTIEGVAFEHNITVNTDVADVKPMSDKVLLEKVIYILLDNALKYTNHGGTINVSLTSDKKNAICAISNTGDGIPAEKLPYIFDRFYKVDSSHSGEQRSFGLGLSMAKSIMDILQGNITCVSAEHSDTCFTLTIPLKAKSNRQRKNK